MWPIWRTVRRNLRAVWRSAPRRRNWLGVIADHYEYLNEEQVIAHIRRGHLFGGFLGDKLVGFIGEHPEGSICILEVLPNSARHRLCL